MGFVLQTWGESQVDKPTSRRNPCSPSFTGTVFTQITRSTSRQRLHPPLLGAEPPLPQREGDPKDPFARFPRFRRIPALAAALPRGEVSSGPAAGLQPSVAQRPRGCSRLWQRHTLHFTLH